MSAPIEFTEEEQSALSRIDDLSKAVAKANKSINQINHRILREKGRRDKLVARKEVLSERLRHTLEVIDTAKGKGTP